uniref:Uncharacterized protein n=1 Tax=Tanacetum cinerariifolium TaxID=118510 RepID=A0A6L2J7N8_TANCI|nr:hypothetical protein [Tanacetum cinerariifolium]
MKFLTDLNDVSQLIRNTILTKDPLPNVKDALYIVEESHRGLHLGGSSNIKAEPSTFVVKTNNNINNFRRFNTNNGNNVNRGPNPNLLCKNCRLIGHTVDRPERPYDEEGDSYNVEGNNWVTFDDCVNTVEDEVTIVATQIGDNVTSEGSVQNNQNGDGPSNILETSPIMRRSTRQRVMPSKFNDFATFHEASQNSKWNKAMNLEMEALHRNKTYVLVDLPSKRKAIGCNLEN